MNQISFSWNYPSAFISIDNCVKRSGDWEHFWVNASTPNRCDWPSAYGWMGLNDNANDDNVIIISGATPASSQPHQQQLIFVLFTRYAFLENNGFITIQLHHFSLNQMAFCSVQHEWIIKHIPTVMMIEWTDALSWESFDGSTIRVFGGPTCPTTQTTTTACENGHTKKWNICFVMENWWNNKQIYEWAKAFSHFALDSMH